jgi:thiamine biosynthesis lipoprotein
VSALRRKGRPARRSATLALAAAALLVAPQAPAREVRLVMGTTAEVQAEMSSGDAAAALAAAFAALDLVDSRMSVWKESELLALNRTGKALLSAPTATVLGAALDVAEASGGAFDPTVEPLLRARGDYGAPPQALTADAERLLLARVGWHRVHFDAVTRRVRLDTGTALDFGGIAKGYAADLAVAALERAGAERGLVDLGDSSLAAFGQTLEIALRDPESAERPPWGVFRVDHQSVSTSGGDQKPGHIVDPRTGRPVASILATTVVAETGIMADALSTAVFVLGARDGLALLTRRGAAGLILTREAGRAVIRTTPGFEARYGLERAPGVELLP